MAGIEKRLADAFAALYSRNTDANGRTDLYGIRVENLTDDCARFDLVATFKARDKYCCTEWGCHFGLLSHPEGWRQIRQVLRDQGLGSMSSLTIRRLRVMIEEGAMFDHQRQNYTPHDAFTYDVGPLSETGLNQNEGTKS
jgi:hypothetical protein